MTYLQCIIQRFAAKIPANMLLPNTNIWSGVIDPFENTRYLPFVFPQFKEKQRIKHATVDQPSPSPPAKRLPIADSRQSPETPQPVSTIIHGEPVNPRTSVGIIAPRKKMPSKNSPLTVIQKADAGSELIIKPDRNSTIGTAREQQQNDLSHPHPQPATRWKTRWRRRYSGDIATAFETEKSKQLSGNVPDRQLHMLSPQQKHVSTISETVAKLSGFPGSKSIRRSSSKRRQINEPRLVIGQLTVDVVPIKPANTPHRRKKTVKKHAEDRRGKLSRAETARFGFGIGQM